MTASQAYIRRGTPIIWDDATTTYLITASSLAAVTGRIGARGDLGAAPRAAYYTWYMEAQWAATPAQFDALELWAAYWDNDTGPANPWANVGSSDAALTATQRANMQRIGSLTVESAAAGPFKFGGQFQTPHRYISPAIYNNSATKALVASGTFAFSLRVTPYYLEMQ